MKRMMRMPHTSAERERLCLGILPRVVWVEGEPPQAQQVHRFFFDRHCVVQTIGAQDTGIDNLLAIVQALLSAGLVVVVVASEEQRKCKSALLQKVGGQRFFEISAASDSSISNFCSDVLAAITR